MKLHFVGVTADQYWSALRIFGKPDVVHPRATWSAMGEIPGEDYVVFGSKAFPVPAKWKGKTAHFDQV